MSPEARPPEGNNGGGHQEGGNCDQADETHHREVADDQRDERDGGLSLASRPLKARTKRILIVDDDRDGVEALQVLLESRGYATTVAHNGQEALDRISTEGLPCLVILDLQMPVMNGTQFLERRSRDPRLASTPVIVVTASEPRLMPGQAVIRKPVDFGILMKHIEANCGPASEH